jgi:hypothetical protein
MSYHILHQFDEQWLADLKQHDEGNRFFLNSSDEGRGGVGARTKTATAARESHRLAIIVAAILMATFALLFALDASRRAEILQRRLDVVEASIKK